MTVSSSHNFWLFLEVLAKRKKFILTFVLVLTLLALIISLLLPKWYQASALLLPPKDLTPPLPGLAKLSEVVSLTKGLELPVMVTASDVYARILKSRTITERIIEAFDLQKRYNTKTFKKTYKELLSHTKFTVTEEGLLMISVEDKDPQVAADMANAFIDELDKMNRRIAVERIRQNREFIEERLAQVKEELDSARRDFERFQIENNAIDFEEQIRLAIEQAIQLKVSLAKIDLELKMKENILSKDNPEYLELQRRRKYIQAQLDRLEKENPDSSFFSLPISAIPSLRGQYEVLYSRVKVNESLYKILLEQLEHAKIQESEKTPTLSVLDWAKPPDLKSRPKRSIIVGGTFGFSLLFAILMAACLEYVARLKTASPEDYSRVMLFTQAFFGWLPGVKKKAGKTANIEVES